MTAPAEETLVNGLGTTRRLTLCGDVDAEARVTQDLARLGAAIDGELDRSLVALVLIGAYARGDGSVILRGGELHASSCYDLLAIVHGRALADPERLARLSAAWTSRLAVDVRLHARTLRHVLEAPPTLTFVEVARGQAEVIAGNPTVLGRLRAPHPKDLPRDASAALLLDAAIGLAFGNLDRIAWNRHAPRHAHHAVLVCGDAFLLQSSHFAFDLHARQAEIARIESQHAEHGLATAYGEAIAYQARPDLGIRTKDALESWYRKTRELVGRVHFRLEQQRLGAPDEPLSYALFSSRLWSTTKLLPFAALTASLRAAREGGTTKIAHLGDARERLTRAAVLLAYAHDRPEARRLAGHLLGVIGTSHDDSSPSDVQLFLRLRKLAARVRAERFGDPLAGARYGL